MGMAGWLFCSRVRAGWDAARAGDRVRVQAGAVVAVRRAGGARVAGVLAVAVGGLAVKQLGAGARRTEIAAAAPPADGAAAPEEPWRKAFEDMYALKNGEVVKYIPRPFIPERQEYWSARGGNTMGL